MNYYGNVNPELLAKVPITAGLLLEIGAGAGALSLSCKLRNPQLRTVAVESHEPAAALAREHLDAVICGDIHAPEVWDAIDRALDGELADAVVLGDVLEHLLDPWTTLERLRARAAPGAVCAICVPNVAHWSLLQQQLRGRWDYAESGLLDRTHLRFFTEATAREMLQNAGWQVIDTIPRIIGPEQTRQAVEVFKPLAASVGSTPEVMARNLSAFQWVVRSSNGRLAQEPIHIAALGLKKVAGVTEARVDYPIGALSTLPDVRAVWATDAIRIPSNWKPGILILHRHFVTDPKFQQAMENLIGKGWVVVSDMDDDPHHWRAYVDSDFYAFRAVHAVTVSTPPLAQMMSQWNDAVKVFPNGIPKLGRPKRSNALSKPLRVFFGALNRTQEWQSLMPVWSSVAREMREQLEWVVVHDRACFDALPDDIPKHFHTTLEPSAYMDVLATCDIALLPLHDTPFNRLKSDLKLIESAASDVVPIVSPAVYADNPAIHRFALIATTDQEWASALRTLCTNRSLLQSLQMEGRNYVASERMTVHQVPERLQYYRELLAARPELEARRRHRLQLMQERRAANPPVSAP